MSFQIRTVNVKEEILTIMSVVSDLSYAWSIATTFVPQMQRRIKADPRTVVLLRSTFLKMSSIMELPLVRMNQRMYLGMSLFMFSAITRLDLCL